MGTEKRDRQRANKAAKQEQEARDARRAKMIRRVRRIVIYVVIFAAVIFIATRVFGGGGDQQSLGLLLGA